MLLGCRNKIILLSDHKWGNGKLDSSSKKYAISKRPCIIRCSQNADSHTDAFKEAKEKIIRETFGEVVELTPSSYDTAWVAMVPSRHSEKQPSFPQCLDWIIENQREDGSWGLNPPNHPLLVKDSLSSTLACLLALHKWRVGHKQVQRGLGFIEKHGWAVDNKDQVSPVGFEIIFPGMIKYAEELDLNLSLDPDLVNLAMRKRDSTIERALQNDFTGISGNLGYIAEGLGELCHWKEMMVHQRQNGSLFDSPATTAAALIYHRHDEKCFEYLNTILHLYKNWVPTVYPTKIHSHLCLVDTLQSLGVHRYFKTEIKNVLDEIYRLWQQKNEEIFSNVAHCAMAFRLLRMSNYEVSSEELAEFIHEEHLFSTECGKITSHVAILELHKASQVAIHEKDNILDKISNWTGIFMEKKLLTSDFLDRMSKKEVELALRKFYATFDRAEHRRFIESYEENNFKILKAAYRSPSINSRDLLIFSINDFDLGLARYREELQQLKRWFEDCKLDQVGISEEYIYRTHLVSIVVLSEHEFSDARLISAKYSMFVTLSDDLFEFLASKDELLNIIELVERWDGYGDVGFYSEKVKLFFSAFYNTIEEVAANAQIRQGRSVKDHLVMLWLEVLKCMLVDRLEWATGNMTPTIEEYLRGASITFGVECLVLTVQYFVGIKLSKDLLGSAEIDDLCSCSGKVMRLLNDLQSYKIETGTESTALNMVSLLRLHSAGTNISEEESMRQIKETIENNRRKLLRMVLQARKGSQLPQAIKDLFWRSIKVNYFFYSGHDEYRSPKKVKYHINEVIYKPLKLNRSFPI